VSTPNINQPYRGITFTNNNHDIMSLCEYVVLAIKPQIFKEISESFTNNNCKCVISIMAGVNSDTIAKVCNCHQVVRIMPNTHCSIG
ncbi:MAG: NAD(P)-binding domain-containing protein, partial [Clostridia bacterium]|nr:NAD(P)-binding domain-containing protein [Clostridia bacterium]